MYLRAKLRPNLEQTIGFSVNVETTVSNYEDDLANIFFY